MPDHERAGPLERLARRQIDAHLLDAVMAARLVALHPVRRVRDVGAAGVVPGEVGVDPVHGPESRSPSLQGPAGFSAVNTTQPRGLSAITTIT